MKISQKLISGILGMATLSASIGAISAHQQLNIAKYFAQKEAEEVAGLLGYFVSYELEYHQMRSQYLSVKISVSVFQPLRGCLKSFLYTPNPWRSP
ncbi:MAG: hypothetical protein V7K97_15570 [Nostoc sp.]|uniref:hypothetical protein n=1 Tax=Nostoc sp. TaxID=1180 RepID=UPI002FFB30A9